MSVDLLSQLADQQFSPVLHRVVTPAIPALGAEFTVTVPGDQVWRVRSIRVGLTTSAAVGNRVPFLVVDDGINMIARLVAGNVVAPSSITALDWIAEYPQATSGQGIEPIAPLLSPCYMLPGWRFSSVTFSRDVGDQFTSIAILAETMFVGEANVEQARRLYERIFAAGMLPFASQMESG